MPVWFAIAVALSVAAKVVVADIIVVDLAVEYDAPEVDNEKVFKHFEKKIMGD